MNILNMLKQLIAGKELARIALLESELRDVNHLVHFAKMSNVQVNAALDQVTDQFLVARQEAISNAKMLSDTQLKVFDYEVENGRLHAKLASAELSARQGWARYDEANKKYMMWDTKVAELSQKLQATDAQTFKWYSALYDSAQLIGVPVGHSITETPDHIRKFLDNRNFVFRTTSELPFSSMHYKRLVMNAQIKLAMKTLPNYVKPGIPCNGCTDNCCTLDGSNCLLVNFRKPLEA